MCFRQIWGLKNWLEEINLTKYYNIFKPFDYTQLLNITKSELGQLCSPEDVDILVVSIEIVKNKLTLLSLLRNAHYKGCGAYYILKQLEFILPSQFEPVLGRVSSGFVFLMKLINFDLQKIKSKPMKKKCMRLFCLYCFYGEQSEYFMIQDKNALQFMRLQLQEEVKLYKKN